MGSKFNYNIINHLIDSVATLIQTKYGLDSNKFSGQIIPYKYFML